MLAPTETQIPIDEQSILAIAAEITDHIKHGDGWAAEADDALTRAEDHYRLAGEGLKALKALKPQDVTWPEFVRAKCDLSQQRADELIRIANRKTTNEEVRGKTADRMRRLRERREAEDRK